MTTAKLANNNRSGWVTFALFGMLLAAPNATVMRAVIETVDPFFFTILRYVAIAIFCLPFIFLARKKISRANLLIAMQAGLFMSVAVGCFTFAILYSQASYVSLLTLINPILLVVFSAIILREKITRKIGAGMSLAAAGVMVFVFLPLAFYQGQDFVFYPLATVLGLINSVAFTMAIIKIRQANEAGMSMMTILGINALIIVAVNVILFAGFGDTSKMNLDMSVIGAALYTGVVVACLGRGIGVLAYEHVGAALIAALTYVETFAALAIPLIVLGEKLSVEMIIGGIMILLGVYVMEHHKYSHAKHAHMARHV